MRNKALDRRLFIFATGLAAALGLTACAIRAPETQYFVLNPKPLPKAAHQLPISVLVETLEISPLYAQERMAFGESAYQVGFDHYRHWATTPDLMVSEAVYRLLAQTGRFKETAFGQELGRFDIRVTGRINGFYTDQRESPWQAKVDVTWELRSGQTDAILAQWEDSAASPVEEKKADAVAAAMSESVRALAERLEQRIAQIAPAAAEAQQAGNAE